MGTSVFVRIALLVATHSLGVEAVAAGKVDLMRREEIADEHQVQLSSSGEFVAIHAKDAPQKVLTKTQVKKDKNQPDYCDFAFPLGKVASNDCANSTTDRVLENFGECAQAAQEAKLPVPTQITNDPKYKWLRPFGCFLADCVPNTGTAKPCYFWNGVEGLDKSKIESGQPVCKRDTYVLGRPNVNPLDGCPPDYEAIEVESDCLLAGPCVGDMDAAQDRVNNFDAEQYDRHPLFCFLGKTSGGQVDDEVYFNEPLPNLDHKTDPPKTPASGGGTPICVVSKRTSFPGGNYPMTPVVPPDYVRPVPQPPVR